jgi:hypothetical protein
MNNDDLNRLSNELLTCYFDKAGAIEMGRIAQKYRVPVGGKIFNKAVERGIGWLEAGDSGQMNETNKSKIFQQGIQNISTKFGATLGRDFSMAPDGGMFVKNELMNKIMADLPPEALAEFKAMGYIKTVASDPFEMLESHLGVPFFTSIEAIAKLRVRSLSDIETAHYLAALAGGMQGKHNWISNDWVVRFFLRVLGEQRFKVFISLKDIPNDEGEAGSLVLEDLLTALGSIEIEHHPRFGRTIDREQLLLLDKVFRGEMYSCAELAEEMRRMGDEHRKNK